MDAVFDPEREVDRHRDVSELFHDVGVSAFERLGADALGGMRQRTARGHFIGLSEAMIKLALVGEEPSDRALTTVGAPRPDTLRRFLGLADLGDLPHASARLAVERGVAAPPRQIALDARTEAVAGPEKFGVLHPQRPAGVGSGVRPPNSANSQGGIAHAFAFTADETEPSMLLGDSPVMQGFWDPESWASPWELDEVREQLRNRAGDPGAPFTTDAPSIATDLIERLRAGEEISPGSFSLRETVLSGGRLHIGDPLPAVSEPDDMALFGGGSDDLFIGTSLEAHATFAAAGIPVLLEMPTPIRAPRSKRSDCKWVLRAGESEFTFAEAVTSLATADPRWREIPPAVVREADPAAERYLCLSAKAQSGGVQLPVSLLMRHSGRGECDVWSTTEDLVDRDEQQRMIRAAAGEIARRSPESPPERALRGLLHLGWAQRHKRRRRIERRNFSALAQMVRSLAELTKR